MSGLVGWSCVGPNHSIDAFANALQTHDQDRIVSKFERQQTAIVRVSHSEGDVRERTEGGATAFVEGVALGSTGVWDASSFVSAYLRDGTGAFLAELTGSFCGVIVDEQRHRVVLFTDRLGLGCLYFARVDDGALVFSTQQKCFAKQFGSAWSVPASAVSSYLKHGHLCGDATWFDGLALLEPGSVLEFDIGARTLRTRRYWSLESAAQGRYRSYDDAKAAVVESFEAACVHAFQGLDAPLVHLRGDVASRMVLAAAERHRLQPSALTIADAESDDLHRVRKACAVSSTPLISRSAIDPRTWFDARMASNWLAEGMEPERLNLASSLHALPRLASQGLDGAFGAVALGTHGVVGYDDKRSLVLLENSRRELASTSLVFENFWPIRHPFADPDFLASALRADVSYVSDGSLTRDLAAAFIPGPLALGPIRETDLNSQASLTARKRGRAQKPVDELEVLFRDNPELEQTIWRLLSDPKALYRDYTDSKLAHAAYWDVFQRNEVSSRTLMLRYVSLEVWLRQLLRAELLPKTELLTPREALITLRGAPHVSVIIPAYNVERYVSECLNSVLNQELEDIEVLVVNDGSTDGTSAVLARYAALDSRVKVIDSPNLGVYCARNIGLAQARGRYISFVDADDYVHPAMLRKLVATADGGAAEVAFCDAYQFGDESEVVRRGSTLGFKPNVPLSLGTNPEMISDGFTTLWNRVYARDFLQQHGLKFDERFRISADMLFLQEVVCRASTLIRVPEALYYYRYGTPKGLTSYEVRNAQYRTHLAITIELMDFWVRQGLFERYAPYVLSKAIRNFLWNTHIDVKKLREVFDSLHEYVARLPVSPTDIVRLAPFERRVLRLLRAGDFTRFSRHIREYRAKMVESKGGELTTKERLLNRASEAKDAVLDALKFKVEQDRQRQRIKVAWPAAKLRMTLDYEAGLAVAFTPPSEAGIEEASEGHQQVTQRVRNRLLLAGDLERARRRRKRGASVRVLHFSNAFSLPSETFTYDVVTGFEDLPSVDNYVMCFKRELARERPFPKTIQLHGSSRADLEQGSAALDADLERVLVKIEPDLIHCHFGWVGIPLVRWLAARKRTLPVVITMHGTDVNMWPARHHWYADALKSVGEYPWVHFTTHSETYRSKLIALGVPASQIEVIPNSFDPKFAENLREPQLAPDAHYRVISVARMDIWKGQEYLLHGFDEFRRTHGGNTSLTLVGYGPQERALRTLTERLGLTDSVRFYGRAAHHEVPVLLKHHDVYVQPSIRHPETLQEEGQPIAVLEAIAAGVPVVVTDTGAMAETVRIGSHEGNALVVPDKDASALASALASVRATRRDVTRQREYIAAITQKHSRDQQITRTLAVYRRALDEDS